MTHQPINLNSIDFSQPDGEFTFRGQSYHIKRHSHHYFFINQKHKDINFIYSFRNNENIEEICQQKYSQKQVEEIIQDKFEGGVERYVQYESTIFWFAIIDKGDNLQGEGYYFSLKYGYWQPFNWKPFRHINLDNILDTILYTPHELFVDKARTAYCNELPKIEDEDLRDSFDPQEATRPLEFVCGSESELKRLTQLAAVTLPELKPLFEHYSGFEVIYQSESDYYSGGVARIETEDWNHEVILSRQAQQLFDLIFEYNFFSGLDWEYNDGPWRSYRGYDPRPCTIRIKVQAPSQHERLEAALELQSWLLGKIPEDEMQSYLVE